MTSTSLQFKWLRNLGVQNSNPHCSDNNKFWVKNLPSLSGSTDCSEPVQLSHRQIVLEPFDVAKIDTSSGFRNLQACENCWPEKTNDLFISEHSVACWSLVQLGGSVKVKFH